MKFIRNKNSFLFYKAFGNEVAIDEYGYKVKGGLPWMYGRVPRPLHWLGRVKFINRFTAFLLKLFLFFGGWFFLYFKEFILFFRFFGLKDKRFLAKLNASSYYALGFSSRAYDVISEEVLAGADVIWIHMPWVDSKAKDDSTGMCCFSLLSKGEALKILFMCLLLTYRSTFKGECRQWILQFYSCYRWMLVKFALDKLPVNRFVCAEHFDRWAVLTDFICHEKFESIGVGNFVLVQHGILSSLNSNGEYSEGIPFKLAYKLKSVTDCFVYDEHSRRMFEGYVFSAHSRLNVNFNFLNKKLPLTEIEGGQVKVLFVGHPACFDFHTRLLKCLPSSFLIFYKPHPVMRIPNVNDFSNWVLITDPGFFPEVDLLISYPSSVVREYAAHEIKTFVHPINCSDSDFEIFSCFMRQFSKSMIMDLSDNFKN